VLLSDCKPTITAQGNLRFVRPGFSRGVFEVTPWRDGFEGSCLRGGQRMISYHWPVQFLAPVWPRALPAAVAAFLADIPAEIRARVLPYQFAQYALLKSQHDTDAGRDLAVHRPHLLWLLAAEVFDGRIDPEHIASYCARKQTQILRRIVRNPSKAQLKWLSKVDLESGTLAEARILREALGRERLLLATAHEQRLSFKLVLALFNRPGLADPVFVRILARVEQDVLSLTAREIDDLRGDIVRLGGALRVERIDQAIARCRSHEDLTRLHDRWTDRLNAAAEMAARRPRRAPLPQFGLPAWAQLDPGPAGDLEFPAPPFPDSSHIEAIRTVEDLRKEAQGQRHCVLSYAPSVAAGNLFIYRVTKPERATLELRCVDGIWLLGQLKGTANREPSDATRESVCAWFEAERARASMEHETKVTAVEGMDMRSKRKTVQVDGRRLEEARKLHGWSCEMFEDETQNWVYQQASKERAEGKRNGIFTRRVKDREKKAQTAGIGRTAIAKAEAGGRALPITVLILARTLGLEPADIIVSESERAGDGTDPSNGGGDDRTAAAA
jgi:hypothetical protein